MPGIFLDAAVVPELCVVGPISLDDLLPEEYCWIMRKRSDLSQKELSLLLGIKQSTLSIWETDGDKRLVDFWGKQIGAERANR